MSHMAEVAPQVRGGQARLLVVSSEAHVSCIADVATLTERQVTAIEAFAVMLLAGAPSPTE